MTEAIDTVTEQERTALLDAVIAREVAAGANVLTRSGFEAVLDAGIKPHVGKNILLTIWTTGVWLIPWFRSSTRGTPRYTVTVDERGHAWSIAHGETEWSPLG